MEVTMEVTLKVTVKVNDVPVEVAVVVSAVVVNTGEVVKVPAAGASLMTMMMAMIAKPKAVAAVTVDHQQSQSVYQALCQICLLISKMMAKNLALEHARSAV